MSRVSATVIVVFLIAGAAWGQCLPAITIGPASLPVGEVGATYPGAQLSASGGTAPYSWTVTGLPTGLAFDSRTARITGDPKSAGTSTVNVSVNDAGRGCGSKSYSLLICPAMAISPSSVADGVVGSAMNVSFAVSGLSRPTWSFSGRLPAGVSVRDNVIGGTPTEPGSFSFSMTASEGSCSETQNYAFKVVCPTITISPASLAGGTAGVAYPTTTFTATGVSASATWSLASGRLPNGMRLSGNALSGTPTEQGSFPFTIQVTDTNGCSQQRSYALSIACPTLTVTPASLTNAVIGQAYSTSFAASGGLGAHTLTMAGSVPGLTFDGTKLSGTPTTLGTHSFTINATDGIGCTGSRGYALQVVCPTVTVSPTGAMGGRVGVAYSLSFSASGGSGSYTFTATGDVPPGLSIVRNILQGTPTTAGTYRFGVRATDGNGCFGSEAYSVTIEPAAPQCPTIAISPTSMPAATRDSAYRVTFAGKGGVEPYTYGLTGNVPPGMSFSGDTLGGTPTSTGAFTFTLTATDANKCTASASYTLTVNPPACPTITIGPSTLPNATAGSGYKIGFNASGGTSPYKFAVTGGSLPPGLSFAVDTISGTPTAAGTYTFTIGVEDANRCLATRSYTLVVEQVTCRTISISPDTIPAATAGSSYRASFSASGGTSPYSFTASGLPSGFSFSGDTLSGLPTTGGTHTITITAADANRCTASRSYTLQINAVVCPTDKPTLTSPPNRALGLRVPLTLTWSAVERAISYKVFAQPEGAATPTQLGSTTGTSLTVNSLPEGTILWWVEAQFDRCPPTESARNVFTIAASLGCTGEAPVLGSPANGATNVANPVRLTWTATTGATRYNVYGALNGNAASIIASSATNSASLTIPDGATVEWFVESIVDGCPAKRSQTFRFTVARAVTCSTVGPGVISPANGAVVTSPANVQWNVVDGATLYKVHAALEGEALRVVGSTTATQLSLNLPRGNVVVQIEAVFNECPSTFSSRISFTVGTGTLCPTTPTALAEPSNGASEVTSPATFKWSAVTNAVLYKMFASYNGSAFELLAETRETSVSRILPPGVYSWYVDTYYFGCEPVRSETFRFTLIDPKRCPTGALAITSPGAGATVTSPVSVVTNGITGAAGYRLWVAMDGGSPAIVAKGTNTTLSASLPSGAAEAYVEALFTDCPSIFSPHVRFTVQKATTCDANQAPSLISPVGIETSSRVDLRWNASNGAIGYRVWLSSNGQPFADLGIFRETTLTRELKPGSHIWFVESLFDNCPALASARAAFKVAEETPRCGSEAPAIVSPADGTTTTAPVTLLWTAVDQAIRYRVYAAKSDGPISLIGDTTETSLTKAIPAGTYLWFAEAVFKSCSSTFSPRVRFTVLSAQNCQSERPQLLTPRNGAETTSPVGLSWSPVSGAVRYVVVAKREDGSFAPLGETAETAMNPVLPPGLIEWYVVAIRAGCDPIESARGSFTVTVPESCDSRAPVIVAPDANSTVIAPVALAWTPVARARAYRVFAAVGDVRPTILTTTSDTVITVTLPPGHVSWHVEAMFDNCPPLESAPGNFNVAPPQSSCRTPDAPQISVVGQVLSGTEYKVRWTYGANAATYELQESDNGTDFATIVVNDTSKTFTYTTTGAPIRKHYRVRAVSACNDERGPYSPVVSIHIVPTNTIQTQTRGTAEIGVRVRPIQTIFVPGQPTPINFTARSDKPWLRVTPANGVLPVEGMTFTLESDPEALFVGANTATLIIEYAGAGKGANANPPATSVPVSTSLVTPVAPGGKNTPPPDALIIPAVAHAAGANNSLFQSDVRVANTSTRTMNYQLFFTPSGTNGTQAGSSTTIQVEPGATVALDDILASFFGSGTTASASGVLEIRPMSATTSSSSLNSTSSSLATATVASSRTYNVTTTGTFGQYIPAVPFANFIARATDGTRAVLSLQQIAQSAAYRTNLGLVEAAGEPAEVLVTVFDGSNAVVGQIPMSLQPAEHKQINAFLAANNIQLEDGRIEVEVTSSTGKVTAYASTVDNISGDPLLVSPVLKSSAAGTRYVIPGVAYTDGLARWRTDVRLYNTSASAVATTLTFYPQFSGDPLVASVTLQPGETRALDNVLSTLFGISSAGAGGSVLVTTDAQSSLIASARTYAQTDAGTYGQFIPAVTPQDGVGLGERSLHLIQLEQSSEYRTNIGLVETTGRDATAEVSLILPDSKLTPKVPVTLPANGFVQFPMSAFGVGNAVYNARISVRVTSGQGKVSAYGSVIDNRTQDPTYVPAQ